MGKIVTIVGARPQFIKAAAVSRALLEHNESADAEKITEVIVHTGQHYDEKMSGDFFSELSIPAPSINLGIAGLSHGAMTGRMLEAVEKVLLQESPDVVLVYGDTNSTLAGALAGSKLNIPVSHVEAGLRSFNLSMPEEKNRMVADVLSDSLFCPTGVAVDNLKKEGRTDRVFQCGDVMFDTAQYFGDVARKQISLDRWGVNAQNYVLATVHRAENTDDAKKLGEIVKGLVAINQKVPVILPLHPRTQGTLNKYGMIEALEAVQVIEPLGYLEMVRLEMDAAAIVTDSGGVQKEAFFHGVPCITVRDETEWTETMDSGWNKLVGANAAAMEAALNARGDLPSSRGNPYGDGTAAKQIINELRGLYF